MAVRTKDAWTLEPTARAGGGAGMGIGLRDRDLLGTGISADASELSGGGGGGGGSRGGALGFSVPWFLGLPITASAHIADLGRTHSFGASARTFQSSVF